MRLGELIRAWRTVNRMGVREAAALIGVSPATLARIERGRTCSSDIAYRVVLWALKPQEPVSHD